jgi:hypothetical protein
MAVRDAAWTRASWCWRSAASWAVASAMASADSAVVRARLVAMKRARSRAQFSRKARRWTWRSEQFRACATCFWVAPLMTRGTALFPVDVATTAHENLQWLRIAGIGYDGNREAEGAMERLGGRRKGGGGPWCSVTRGRPEAHRVAPRG